MRAAATICVSICLSMGMPLGRARAEDPPTCRATRPGMVECAEITIEGTPGRSFLLLGRSRIEYEAPPISRDLVREVPATVRRAPF